MLPRVSKAVYWPSELQALWERIYRCDRCRRDPALGDSEIEWDRYVPLKTIGILPPGRRDVTYLLVAAEPSGDWVKTRRVELARQRRKPGSRNFNGSTEDLVLQFAVEHWLLKTSAEAYYITDLAKCTIPVAKAGPTRRDRYANCASFLEVEVELLRPRAMIAVGRPAFAALLRQRRRGWPPIFEISHYGKAGQGHWARYLSRGWEVKVPTLRVLASWMRERYELSLHGDPLRPPNAMHLRLLGTYRRQLKDIRALLDADPFAVGGKRQGMRASIRGSDERISGRGEWILAALR